MSIEFIIALLLSLGLDPLDVEVPVHYLARVGFVICYIAMVGSTAWCLSDWIRRPLRLSRPADAERSTSSIVPTSDAAGPSTALTSLVKNQSFPESFPREPLLAHVSGPSALRRQARRRMLISRHLLSVVSLAGFGALCYLGSWPLIVHFGFGLNRWLFVDEFLILLPCVVADVLAEAIFYSRVMLGASMPNPRAIPIAPLSLWRHLDWFFRGRYGIWIAGAMFILTARDLVDWFFPGASNDPLMLGASTFLTTSALLIISPWLLRFVWRTEPLRPGLLRDELEGISRRARFRYSNILYWKTGGGTLNAAVAGMIPQIRYVLLSDALLRFLAPSEVVAVFGHEIGHIKHHHIGYFIGFVSGSVFLLAGVADLCILWTPVEWRRNWWIDLLVLQALPFALIAAYLGVFFGMLSRRFERQADLFGCRIASIVYDDFERATKLMMGGESVAVAISATSPTETAAPSEDPTLFRVHPEGVALFIDALEKVSDYNGGSRTARKWRHGSIVSRVRYLERVRRDPALADREDRVLWRWKWGIALALSAGLLAVYPLLWVIATQGR